MDKDQKKILTIVGIVEAVILVFCLTVSIIVLAKWDSALLTYESRARVNGAFIAWFQSNPTLFFIIIVLPVFIIFLIDAIYLIVYASKKPSAITADEREAIQAQAREEARKEIEAEMAAEKKPEGK
ncbi:MAG: hypothetical protein LKG11_02440 [Bacilli bacterium]|jgi:uncharacterized membrane protein|nr:hypothetical protein [Bacilli bacterium]